MAGPPHGMGGSATATVVSTGIEGEVFGEKNRFLGKGH